MADPGNKPRVLMSILKCACFEHLESEALFTAISAGFGRFECERLLKPSGVELMNLPQSASIEISVLRRDRVTGQKQLLYHGIVPLSAVHPLFSGSGGGPAGADGELPVWESWLGLFSSDVNLKAQNAERLFHRCLEMGTSNARFPRLLLRLQCLAPGLPSTSSGRHPSYQPPPVDAPVPAVSQTGPPGTSGPSHPTASSSSSRAPSNVSVVPPQSGSFRSGGSSVTSSAPGRQEPRPDTTIAITPVVPPPGGPPERAPGTAPGGPPERASGTTIGGPPDRVPGTGSLKGQGHHPPKNRSMGSSSPSTLGSARLNWRQEVGEGSTTPFGGTSSSLVDRRQSYDDLVRDMEKSKAAWTEQRAALESALLDAETKISQKGPEALPPQGPAWPSTPAATQALQAQLDEMQKRMQDIEVENQRLKDQDSGRQLAEVDFLERVAPLLAKLGRHSKAIPGEAPTTVSSTRSKLEEVAAAFTDATNRATTPQASSTEALPDPLTEEALRAEVSAALALAEEGISRALDGGPDALEQWIAQEVSSEKKAQMEQVEGLLPCLQRAATASVAPAIDELAIQKEVLASSDQILPLPTSALRQAPSFYRPVKTDPVDCLVASHLLRLGVLPSTAEFSRIEAGTYCVGVDQQRVSCFIERGQVMVQQLSGSKEGDVSEVDSSSSRAMDIASFLKERGLVLTD